MFRFTSAKRKILTVLVLFFAIILPATFLIKSVNLLQEQSPTQPGQAAEEKTEKNISPSLVAVDWQKYNEQRVTIRGRVFRKAVVCYKQECPAEDSCCSCPKDRDLVVLDEDSDLAISGKDSLRLVDENKKSLCQRIIGSCDYNCQDWVFKAVYDIYGTYYYEAPPAGMNFASSAYFQVRSKNLIKKSVVANPLKNVGQIFKSAVDYFKELGSSNSYVLD